MCGASVVDARRVSLEIFADHWGNAMFRELLMFDWPHSRACGVRCLATASNPSTVARALRAPFPPVWLIYKLALNGTDDPRRGGAATVALQRVATAIRAGHLFDVLGIVEQFQLSMAAFDCMLPLAGNRTWVSESTFHYTSHNSKQHANESERLLAQARKSTAIRGALAADLELYHTAVLPTFAQQNKAVRTRTC